MKKLLFTLSLIFSASAFSGVSVIVHPENGASLGEAEISRIFLGKMKSYPGAGPAVPINLAEGSAIRGTFEQTVLNKSASQIKAYWSKLVFTGKGTPPKDVASDAEVIGLVKSNPSLIGYVDSASVTPDVKVIATF